MDYASYLRYPVLLKGGRMQMNIDFWNLLYNYLEERRYDNFHQNAMQDADYLKFSKQEQELYSQYENLNLSDEQRKVILNWIDAITVQNEAYTAIVFRMAIQCCFSLLLELADLK